MFVEIRNLIREDIFDLPKPELVASLDVLSNPDPLAINFNIAMEILMDQVKQKEKSNPNWILNAPNKLCVALDKDRDLIRSLAVYLFLINIYRQDILESFSRINNVNHASQNSLLNCLQQLRNLNPAPPEAVLTKLEAFISVEERVDEKTYHRFTGNLLSGKYTKYEHKLFSDLQAELATGHVLTAGTKSHFHEGDVAGLRSKHVYAIMNVFNKEQDGKIILYVRLRNPWHRIGRVYDQANEVPHAVEDENGEFDLDISEFIRYYEHYFVGTIPTPDKIQVEMQQQQLRHDQVLYDLLNIVFENLITDDAKEEFIAKLLAKDPDVQNQFFSTQSENGIYALTRFLQYHIGKLEKEILKYHMPVLQRDHQELPYPYAELHAIQHRNVLLTRLQNYSIQKSVKEYEAYQRLQLRTQRLGESTAAEPFVGLSEYFRRQDLELIKSHKLMHSFKFASSSQEKDDFIFELLNQPKYNIQACLQNQSIRDLYEMCLCLEAIISQKKFAATINDTPQLKTIVANYLHAEQKLLNILKSNFAIRLNSSIEFATVKTNAEQYMREKYRGHTLKRITHSVRTFFSTTSEDKYLHMYKHHLKYKDQQQNKKINQLLLLR